MFSIFLCLFPKFSKFSIKSDIFLNLNAKSNYHKRVLSKKLGDFSFLMPLIFFIFKNNKLGKSQNLMGKVKILFLILLWYHKRVPKMVFVEMACVTQISMIFPKPKMARGACHLIRFFFINIKVRTLMKQSCPT